MTHLSLIYESTGFALLTFGVVFLSVFSFVYLQYTKRRIRIGIDIPLKMTEAGQTFGLQIETDNRSLTRIERLEITLQYGPGSSPARETQTIYLTDIPKGKNRVMRRLTIAGCGYYIFSIRKVRIFDPFYFFYARARLQGSCALIVLPSIEEVPVKLGEAVKQFFGEPVDYDESQAGNDPNETYEIREFRDGDKLQRVHWKLSARTDDLMVKESAHPKACPVVLFMPDCSGEDARCMDYMTSLSFTLMDQKCFHYLVWFSKNRSDLIRARVDDEESFFIAIMTCLQDSSKWPGEDRLERYQDKYRGDPYLHSIVGNENGTAAIDKDKPVKVESLREELFLR